MSSVNFMEFMGDLIKLQLGIKMNHWFTPSYNRHKITDKLHVTVSDLIDRLIETYQGRYGKEHPNMSKYSLDVPITVSNQQFDVLIDEYIDKVMTKYYPYFNKEMVAIMDELLEALQQSKYLLSLQ